MVMTSEVTRVNPTVSGLDPQVEAAMQMQARLEPLRDALGLKDLTDGELSLFAMVALHSRLDPFAKQIYAIKRQGKVTFQTGIDGFRASAEETDQYRGSEEPEYGPAVERPFPHPEWARVIVHRSFPNGETLDQSATAYWDEFYPGDQQGFQWKKMPRVMLAKCAEAAAFRKAFPKRFGQVYEASEMEQAEAVEVARPVAPTAAQKVAERRAAIEARTVAPIDEPAPATGTADAEAVDVAGTTTAAPAALAQCDGWDHDLGRCVKEAGHPNNHVNSKKESWRQA